MNLQPTTHHLPTKTAGMTLIEVLVTITIIAILAGILLPNLNDLRRKARDQRRKADIKAIAEALEAYKINQTIPQYPTVLPSPGAGFTDGVGNTYMKEVPRDPLFGSDSTTYFYRYLGKPGNDTSRYYLAACLEIPNDPQITPNPGGTFLNGSEGLCPAPTAGNGGLWYIKTEP